MHFHFSSIVSEFTVQQFPTFLVIEVTTSYHGEDGVVDGSLVVKSHHHLLLELCVRYLSSDGDSSLDGFFNLSNQWGQFLW